MRESAKLQTFACDGTARRAVVEIVENFILFLFKALYYLMLVLNCEKMEIISGGHQN